MDADAWRVQLASGDGLVVRSGSTLLLALPKGDQQEAFIDSVRDAVTAVVRSDPAAPGRRVARTIAGLLASADDAAVPAMVVAAATEDGLALLLVGDVDVQISRADGSVEELSGRDASTWVDKVVRGAFSAVSARVDTAAEIDARSDFGSGAVRAGGFRLLPAAQPDEPPNLAAPPPAEVVQEAPVEPPLVEPLPVEPQPAAVAAPSAAFTAVAFDEPLPAEELIPLPVLGSPTPALDEGSVEVQGIVCSRGHFNDPTSIYCATCGISMVHQTHNLVPGPRPPLGVVVLDDGSVFPLNDDYVIGREPGNSDDVVAGRALPLQIEDPDAMVSRVHAKILLQGWDVRIQDVHSSNGTFVTRPGETDGTRLAADEPMTILPGTRVAMGSRSLVFDSYRKH
jgi:hypothetical protein